MSLRGSIGREPARSRVIIVGGLVMVALTTAGMIWAQTQPPRSYAYPIAIAAWFAVLMAFSVSAMVVSARTFRGLHLRPTRFGIVPGGFDIPFGMSPGFTAVLPMVLTGMAIAQLSDTWREAREDATQVLFVWLFSIALAVILSLALTVTWMSWRGLFFRLTPGGIVWRGPFGSRVIPWESLAPGGPPRPVLGWAATRLGLAVIRPELVRQRGWGLGAGARERPFIPLQNDIHPWFLTDAIRWYVEHPADRAAIGTAEEHQRLVSALVGAVAEPSASVPPPITVRSAVWVTYAAVAWGILVSVAQISIAFAWG